MTNVKVFYSKTGTRWMRDYDTATPSLVEAMTDFAIVFNGELDITTPDDVFTIFNRETGNPLATDTYQRALQMLGVGHASMSCGDILQLGDADPVMCTGDSWKQLILIVADADGGNSKWANVAQEVPKKAVFRLHDAWCTCEMDKFHSYPEDGQCACGVYKHHVHCAKCGGISQVG